MRGPVLLIALAIVLVIAAVAVGVLLLDARGARQASAVEAGRVTDVA